MKIFEDGSKVNFVDINNVFVGYDLSQKCCEDADWFLSLNEETSVYDDYTKRNKLIESLDLSNYVFDKKYFVYVKDCDDVDGGMVIFLLKAKKLPNLFLHLYNHHNGYYSHGFEFKYNDFVIKEAYL